MSQLFNTIAIMLAGGSSARMNGAVDDKITAVIAGKPAIQHSIEAFMRSGSVGRYIFVCRDDEQEAKIRDSLGSLDISSTLWTRGGKLRQDSVWAGLKIAPAESEIILVHDCARPLVSAKAIQTAVIAARETGAASLGRPVTDTIKEAAQTAAGYLMKTHDRAKLWAMETPQVFKYPLLKDAYRKVIKDGHTITDDLSAIEPLNIQVSLISNGRPNPKLTTPEDLALIEYLLLNRK